MRTLFLGFLLSLSIGGFSQVNIDSLSVLSYSETDSIALKALTEWDNEIYRSDPQLDYELNCRILHRSSRALKYNPSDLYRNYYAGALHTLGLIHQNLSNHDSSIWYYNEAVKIRKEMSDYSNLFKSMNNLANVYRDIGMKNKSMDMHFQNMQICKKENMQLEYGAALHNIANGYLDWSKYELAEEYLNKSLEIKLRINDMDGLSKTYGAYGNLYEELGDFPKSIEYHLKAVEIETKSGDIVGRAISELNLANVYQNLGNYEKAQEHYNFSLVVFEKMSYLEGIVAVRNNIGSNLSSMGRLDEAKKLYHETIQMASKSSLLDVLGVCYNNLGLSALGEDSIVDAISYFNMSVAYRRVQGNEYGVAVSHNNLGDAYFRLKDQNITRAKAKEYLDSALQVFENINTIEQIIQTRRNLFKFYYTYDSIQSCIENTDHIIELRLNSISKQFSFLSEFEKALYMKTWMQDFNFLYAVSLANWKENFRELEKSYNTTLMLKGLLLKSSTAMRNAVLSSGDSVLTEQYYDWIALKRRIAKGYSEGGDTKELEEQANELEKELVKGSQEFQDMKKVQELTWKEVQKGLNSNESAVEFIRFTHQADYRDDETKEEIYAALILKPDSEYPEMIGLFTEEDLEKILGSFPGNNLSYIEQIYGSKENTKTQLYDLIWKPMEESLKGAKKVYVSPVGLLHKISFAALAKEQDVYLCDLYDIETMSSTGKIALKDNDPSRGSAYTYTVFGGVDYNSDSTETELWSYLSGSLTEVEKIKGTLKKKEVNYYTAKQASEENFKSIAPKSNILHIATHGFFYPDPEAVEEEIVDAEESSEDLAFRGGKSGFGVESFVKNKNPLMRSGLALAGANDVWSRTQTDGEDGVLTAAEVATIDMRNTELVVLSACETGLGDIKGSEGVYGLQRSFKMAGVNYIIMSLWQVPDKETAEFMTTFYKHLTKTNDIKQSFNLTQKAMRKKYDPYYWAAFVLVE